MNLSFYNTNLPPHLRVLRDEIEGHARDYGLDFFETIFEVVDADALNEIAAYGGFPTRYPHWSFGMQYEELKKGYEYGLSKIYEMVINNDPCYAYLMRCNHTVDQKLVMAHVYGHCDFFKNNAYFGHTTRKMMDEIANHAARVRHYVERFGEDEVEAFMDRCMSIDDLIDIHSVAIRRRDDHSRYDFSPRATGDDPGEQRAAPRFKAKPYMADYINPRGALKVEDDEGKRAAARAAARFPERPEKDVLMFLIEHAPMKNWQRDVLSIVRDEAYYFYPQGQTKILNEGWASFWHSTIMTQKVLDPSEVVDYADHHSGTMATSGRRLNPYKVGIELLRDEALRYNPNETLIYRELAWHFQHKMGANLDNAHMTYKREWMRMMTEVLGSHGKPNWDGLLNPQTDDARARAKLLREGAVALEEMVSPVPAHRGGRICFLEGPEGIQLELIEIMP